MIIKKWTSSTKKVYKIKKVHDCYDRCSLGGLHMENVIELQDYKYETKNEECEWDIISDIFQKAIKRKGLTKTQVECTSKKILDEVRNK